jgi:hypothetical protein
MTLFSIALLGEHPKTVSLSGMAYNLLWVTLGNILSGSLFWRLATGCIPAAKKDTARRTMKKANRHNQCHITQEVTSSSPGAPHSSQFPPL